MTGNPSGEIAARLADAIRQPGAPQWIGHVVSGIPEVAAAGPDLDPKDAARTRVARLVSMLTFEQDRALEQVQTGSLLRTVAEGKCGAVYCLPVVRGRHIIGILDGAGTTDAVDEADARMIKLVDGLRRDIGLASQNAGGLARVRDEIRESTGPVTTPGPELAGPASGGPHGIVGTTGVHWVARVADRTVEYTDDCFDEAEMAKFFVGITPEARRRFYTDFARSAVPLANRVGRLVRPAVGGPLRRLVLDVEQGALAVHRVPPAGHLVGVTLDQSRVHRIETTLRAAADELSRPETVR